MYAIMYIFGLVLAVLAVFMFFVAFIALALQEPDFLPIFLSSASLVSFVAGALIFISRGGDHFFKRHKGFLLVFLLWGIVPAFISIPFYLSGYFPSLFDAYFESVSAFTTTGASLFTEVDSVPRTLIFWRCIIDWLGGLTTLGIIFLLFAPIQFGGMPVWLLHTHTASVLSISNQLLAVSWVLPFYSLITLSCFLFLTLAGILPLDAINLSMSIVATSGFDPVGRTIGSYDIIVQLILAFFLILGTTSIVWQRLFVKHWSVSLKYENCYEFFCFGLILCLSSVCFVFFLYDKGQGDFFSVLWVSFFSALSLLSTSGFEIHPGIFSIISPFPIILLILIGGTSFSAAGGIKVFRLCSVFSQILREINRLIYPHGKFAIGGSGGVGDLKIQKATWLFFLFFIGVSLLGTLVLTAIGTDFNMSFFAIVANLTNTGSLYSNLAADMPTGWVQYGDMSITTRSFLAFVMILGRMEVVGFLILCNRNFWRW